MADTNTKQCILDTAERLFALRGYHHTSLRKITGEAGVNLAAVNYHFGSKEALLESIFEHHLTPLNRIRQENLEAVRSQAQQQNKPIKVADIIRAFIEPTLEYRDRNDKTRYFIALVGRSMSETDDTVRRIFLRHIKPLGFLLYQILKEALPHLEPETLYWRLQCTIGVVSHIMKLTGNIQLTPEGIQPHQDAKTLAEQLIPFLTAGLEAP